MGEPINQLYCSFVAAWSCSMVSGFNVQPNQPYDKSTANNDPNTRCPWVGSQLAVTLLAAGSALHGTAQHCRLKAVYKELAVRFNDKKERAKLFEEFVTCEGNLNAMRIVMKKTYKSSLRTRAQLAAKSEHDFIQTRLPSTARKDHCIIPRSLAKKHFSQPVWTERFVRRPRSYGRGLPTIFSAQTGCTKMVLDQRTNDYAVILLGRARQSYSRKLTTGT